MMKDKDMEALRNRTGSEKVDDELSAMKQIRDLLFHEDVFARMRILDWVRKNLGINLDG